MRSHLPRVVAAGADLRHHARDHCIHHRRRRAAGRASPLPDAAPERQAPPSALLKAVTSPVAMAAGPP
jgi:hypothetical protein